MDTSEPDQWSLGGNPSSITSFFKLPFVNGSSDKLIESPICTANCGLGWRFIIISTITREPGTQQTKFQISFDQHSIAASKDLVLSSAIISFEKLVGPAQDTFALSTRRPISRPVFLAEYSSLENFTGIATIQIKIEFNPSFTLTPSVPLATPKLQKVLESSLTGQDLGNTRFYLFTRRASKNVAFGPQLLFANSSLLEGHSETLGKLLDGKTPEAVKIVGQQLPSIREGSYDYDSDSDMESDHEDNDAENRKVDRSGIKFKRPGQPMTNSVSQNIAAHMDDSQVLFIPNISFTTWKSLMFYLYTKEIHFKKLTSATLSTGTAPNEGVTYGSPSCSPRSMYRLARKLGLPELELLSLNAIEQDLTQENIITELFSHFTSEYPAVQKIEINALMRHMSTEVFDQLLLKMQEVVAGNIPHCYAVVSAVMRKMREGGSKQKHKSNGFGSVSQSTMPSSDKIGGAASIAQAPPSVFGSDSQPVIQPTSLWGHAHKRTESIDAAIGVATPVSLSPAQALEPEYDDVFGGRSTPTGRGRGSMKSMGRRVR